MKFEDFDVLTFDCYGTLIDWNGGIGAVLARVFDEDHAGDMLARYHDLEREIEKDGSLSYRDVMTEAMRRLGAPAGQEEFFAQMGVNVTTRTTPPQRLGEKEQSEFIMKALELAPKYRTELLKP